MGGVIGVCSIFQKKPLNEAFRRWHAELLPFGIQLHKAHIIAVFEAQALEESLPSNLLLKLENYLKPGRVDVAAKIEQLKQTHIGYLREQSKDNLLLHHALQHALEIEMRVSLALRVLNIWQGDTPYERALREIISCIVFFHDYEQGQGSHDNERMTANEVAGWLVDELGLPDDSPLIELIKLFNQRITEFGTTMLYSPKAPKDLLELLFLFQEEKEDVYVPNPVATDAMSNDVLVNTTNVISLLTGLFDKNPGACLHAVKDQLEGPFATAPAISAMLGSDFLLPDLKDYYPGESFEVNQQAFLMMVVPHIAMRTEFAKNEEMKVRLFDFVQTCRQVSQHSPGEFDARFTELFESQDMVAVLDTIFFDRIEAEQAFCTSQEPGLTFMQQKLQQLGYSGELIKTDVPAIDAENLGILKDFYLGISEDEPDKKINLCKSLLLAVIFQAGEQKRLSLGGAFLDDAASQEAGLQSNR